MIERSKHRNLIAALSLPRLRLFSPTTLVNRRWWLSTLLVLVAMVVMAWLGFWQLDRLEQRRARAAFLAHQLALPPLPLTDSVSLPEELTTLKTRRGTVTGDFDLTRQVALKHQNWQGSPGIHLITPLLIEGGSQAVLVDRGWLPQAEASPENWAGYDQSGRVEVQGFIRLSETLPQGSPSAGHVEQVTAPQAEWYRVDIADIQTQLPYELLPIYLLQSPPEGQAPELPYQIEPEFDLSDGPHLGYAIQWFIFALILGVGYLRYVSKQTTEETEETLLFASCHSERGTSEESP